MWCLNRCREPGGVSLCLGTSLQIAPSKDLPAKADKMVCGVIPRRGSTVVSYRSHRLLHACLVAFFAMLSSVLAVHYDFEATIALP